MEKCEKNGIENLKDPRDFIKYHKEEYHLSKIQCNDPIDTSSSIRHRYDAEIPRGNFVKILSILKGESTWKS